MDAAVMFKVLVPVLEISMVLVFVVPTSCWMKESEGGENEIFGPSGGAADICMAVANVVNNIRHNC
jgi:hypothetical protein